MLVECNEAGILLDNIGSDESGTAQIDLDLDGSTFLNSSHINENVLFTTLMKMCCSQVFLHIHCPDSLAMTKHYSTL